MTRTIALNVVGAAIRHALAEKYPTRSVEYLLAWVMIAWSGRVLWPGDIMVGLTYQHLLAIAPEPAWGVFGLIVGGLRIVALIRNGGWKQSPMARFLCALLGLNFWLVLTALYSAAIVSGAQDFPFRAAFPVFMFFEAYSCYRCGQDHAAMLEKAKRTAPAEADGGAHGGC